MNNYPAGTHDSDFHEDPNGDEYLTPAEQDEQAAELAERERQEKAAKEDGRYWFQYVPPGLTSGLTPLERALYDALKEANEFLKNYVHGDPYAKTLRLAEKKENER